MTGAVDRCAACAAPLAEDQRFCLACGLRCAPDELWLAALPRAIPSSAPLGEVVALPRRPVVRSAAITAVVVLSMGVAIGATIGPATVGETAAAQAPLLVVTAPPPTEPAPGLEEEPATEETATAEPAIEEPASERPAFEPVPAPAAVPVETEPLPAEEPSDNVDPALAADEPPPGSVRLAGAVVASDPGAGRLTLLDRDGALHEIHAAGCGVAPGDDLHLRARPLANGTWAADRIRRLPDPATRFVAIATVSWVDPASGRYALGARGTTLVVAVPSSPAPVPPPHAMPPAAPPALPAVGERVRVALELPASPPAGSPPAPLTERRRMVVPPAPDVPTLPLELRGRVTAVDTDARTLALALDPADPAAATVTLAVPAAIEPAAIFPALDVAITATLTANGYALAGISADGDALAADDAGAIQGDQAPPDPAPEGEAGTSLATCALLERP